MVIQRHPDFDKNFTKRITPFPKLLNKFRERLSLFISNPLHPILHDHKLVGTLEEHRSFSVTGDIRVIYKRVNQEIIILKDIGSHNQVY